MTDLYIESLIGKTILLAEINENKDLVVLTTPNEKFYLTWEGDCCASCFLAHASGIENLIEAVVADAYNSEWITNEEGDWNVVETMGTRLRTTKGYVEFESRVEHNGYYGGRILISTEAPLDQYRDKRYYIEEKFPTLVPLKDF